MSAGVQTTLAALAERHGLQVQGDGDTIIKGVCTLTPGLPGHLGFLANPRYQDQLRSSAASAVVLSAADAASYDGNALLAKDPYLSFARIAAGFAPAESFSVGIHPTAVIDPSATVDPSASVAAHAVIGARSRIGAGSHVGAGCAIGDDVQLGQGCRLEARVYLGDRVQLGDRVRVNPGAVIGSRGFGLARGPEGWEEVPQIGGVRIGNDVEIGANSTIDRGAIEDTVIGNGVKLDNQIQIAHNVQIGDFTAIAACVGIAGSSRIGARCLIGGGAGISGHLTIGDDVMVMAFTMVTKSLEGPGQFGSAYPAIPGSEWRKQIARVRRLDKLESRVGQLEKRSRSAQDEGDGGD